MKRAQVIYCKCGASFAACLEPECYTDKDWLKDLAKYVKDGCTVDMVYTDKFSFQQCTCKKPQPEPQLF